MSPTDKADAIREPRVGDVWEKGKTKRHVLMRWFSGRVRIVDRYDKPNFYGWVKDPSAKQHARWCQSATLIQRGPEVKP